ncbi:MAG: hypothetical protein JWR15_3170 [Prosthecobacter sp.]|nr:hypothetical protein [Prosthecobacter sp.]
MSSKACVPDVVTHHSATPRAASAIFSFQFSVPSFQFLRIASPYVYFRIEDEFE